MLPKIEFNAPVTVCYALLALAATLLPVQNALAIYGPIRPTDVGFLFRLSGWTLAHGDLTHYFSNVILILLMGPVLEARHGSAKMLGILFTSSVVVGLAHCLISPGSAVIGASGTAFCLIMMSAFLAGRGGSIPFTVVLVAVLYLGREIMNLLDDDNVSQSAHLLGGLLGIFMGMRGGKPVDDISSRIARP